MSTPDETMPCPDCDPERPGMAPDDGSWGGRNTECDTCNGSGEVPRSRVRGTA
jgi:DnaJ-class molecular chaperone